MPIPDGELFGGRRVGGGARGQVYGSSVYGSGYTGETGFEDEGERGVSGKGFPFWFWPVVWSADGQVVQERTSEGAGYLYNTEVREHRIVTYDDWRRSFH